jgi:large subunit ribosomal protein L9
MELILIKPVANLGACGDVVKVAEGYARNYLLPKKLARPVSTSAAEQAAAAKRKVEKAEAERRQALQQVAERLAAASCTMAAAATEEGHLYGSVSPADVAKHLQADGFEVTEAMVKLDEHIKELGVFPVVVALAPDVEATVKVWVVKE